MLINFRLKSSIYLDAAAAAADPFHSEICLVEPFVDAIGRLVVVDKGETG